jgi:hypothetical protein
MAKLAVSLSFNEDLSKNLQNQLKTEIKLREDTVDVKNQEIEGLKEKARLKMADIQVEMDIKDAEIESLHDQINQKTMFIAKMEQSYGSDIGRLEKKLAAQSKLCEELSLENHNSALQAQIVAQKHSDEIKALKHKIQEQQSAFDLINAYVEQQQLQHQEEQYQDNDTRSSVLSFGDSYYGDYSPYSRTGSMLSSYRPSLAINTDADDVSMSGTSTLNTPMDKSPFFFSDHPHDHSDYVQEQPGTNVTHDTRRSGLSVSIDLNHNTVNHTLSMSEHNAVHTPVPTPQPGIDSPPRFHSFTHRSTNQLSTFQKEEIFNSLDIDQSRYDQILYGLTLATSIMECNLEQEKQLRNFLIKSEYNYLEKVNGQQYQIDKLLESEKQLQDIQMQLQDSLKFNQTSQSSLQQRYIELESKYNEQMKEFYRVNKQEKVGNIHVQNLESSVREQKVLMEKVKTDLSQQELECQDLRLRHFESEGRLEHALEQYKLLQTFCEVLQQEKSLLTKEKDDLLTKCNFLISQNHMNHAVTSTTQADGESSNAEEETKEWGWKSSGQETVSMSQNIRDSDISSIIGKYRHTRSSEIRNQSLSALKLSDSIGTRLSQGDNVNTLRTYALNTGAPLTIQNNEDGSITVIQKERFDSRTSLSRSSPLKRR